MRGNKMKKFQEKDESSNPEIDENGSKISTTMKNKDSETNEKGNLEYVLRELKLTGRYHIIFLLQIGFLILNNSGYSLHYIFSAEIINYVCQYSYCKNSELLLLQQNSSLDFKCNKYELLDDNGACTADSFDTFRFSDCTEWVYSASDSFVAEVGLVAEMMTTKNRPLMVVIFGLCDGLGAMIMTALAYISPNWRTMLIYLYSPTLIVIIYIFTLDESPRWLLINGRKAEAESIIKKAAKMNNIVIDESKIANLRSEERSNINLWAALRVTFASRKLLIRLLLCFCMWFTALFNAYSLLINSVSLEGNKYINFILVSISAIAGGIILVFILTKFKRKAPLIISLTLTGVFCVSQAFVPKGHRWLSILLYLCGKINSGITIKMVYLYTTELFPTYTRNTMLALCSAVGRTGAILAPLTPLLVVYWSGLSTFLVGILSLVTASIVTMMPDTSEDVLPDDVQQAEVIGIKENKKKNII